MTALIPVRGRDGGKTRLAQQLQPHERSDLIWILAQRMFAAVLESGVADRVVLVTREAGFAATARQAFPEIVPIVQPPAVEGLNAGLTYARSACPAGGHLVLFADLPLIEPADVRLLAAGNAHVIIGSDRRGEGTNVLLLRGAETAAFRFQFGQDSHRKHMQEARRLQLSVNDMAMTNLGFDLDTVEDWFDLPVQVRHDLARQIGANGEHASADAMQLIPGDTQERYTH